MLRLIADERVSIDDPANDHLRTVRLADDSVTVRELLSHVGGVDAPAPASLYAGTVPSLISLYGPVLPCSGPRDKVKGKAPSEYAALGQLIADVTGPYTEAVTRMVLDPLGMTGSSFLAGWPSGPGAVTGYGLEADGTFEPDLDDVTALPRGRPVVHRLRPGPVRTGWASLLPPASPARRSGRNPAGRS